MRHCSFCGTRPNAIAIGSLEFEVGSARAEVVLSPEKHPKTGNQIDDCCFRFDLADVVALAM